MVARMGGASIALLINAPFVALCVLAAFEGSIWSHEGSVKGDDFEDLVSVITRQVCAAMQRQGG